MLKRFLLILPVLATSAIAQEIADDAPVEARHYTVEMIIFAYGSSVSSGNEIFVPDLPPQEESESIDEFGNALDSSLQSVPEIGPQPAVEESPEIDEIREPIPFEVEMLPREDFSLMEVYEHLDRLDAYEPLVHFGWTQATYADQATEARPLSFFVTPPPGLDGDINLYLSRYLHLVLNLQLDAPGTENAFNANVSEFALSYPVRYRISEDRIFRNGDLRYFDHPKFGALAKITRVEDDEDALEDSAETELLGYDGE